MYDRSRQKLLLTAMLLATSLSICSGCGSSQPKTYRVSGRVLFSDGSPVRTGMVELESTELKLTASGRIQQDASFVLGTFTESDGAVAGDHQAIVVQMVINDGLVKHAIDHGSPVDPSFGTYTTSPLSVRVETIEQNDIRLMVEKAAPARR